MRSYRKIHPMRSIRIDVLIRDERQESRVSGAALVEYANRIKAEGFTKVPELENRGGGVYGVISGHAEIAAAALLDWREIPCFVLDSGRELVSSTG